VPAVVAREKGKPFVLTPHGMLYPQALAHSKWQKKLLGYACANRDIREAACIHVTCAEEMQHIRALGFTNPVAVIPNPVPDGLLKEYVPKAAKVTFGYLGRLHPRKRVERIIEALGLLSEEEQARCQLVIMGSGEPSYESFLKARVEQLHLRNTEFLGFVEGVEKERRLAQLHTLFVPSDFENFGMIVAEALRGGTPVFAGTGTPW
jgi:glycosyltransferase involved in cell wall biosynthesis